MRMFEFVLNVTMAGAGAALFILSKPLARGLSEWTRNNTSDSQGPSALGSGQCWNGVELQNYFHLVSDLWSVCLSHKQPSSFSLRRFLYADKFGIKLQQLTFGASGCARLFSELT